MAELVDDAIERDLLFYHGTATIGVIEDHRPKSADNVTFVFAALGEPIAQVGFIYSPPSLALIPALQSGGIAFEQSLPWIQVYDSYDNMAESLPTPGTLWEPGDSSYPTSLPVSSIASRVVEGHARAAIAHPGLRSLVEQTARLVDSHLERERLVSGSIIYQESLEDPGDWEIVIVSRLNISSSHRFDLSLRIGEALSQLIGTGTYNPSWRYVTYRLDLA